MVILIDDIYDMYSRLQGTNDLYEPETIQARADRLHQFHRRPDTDATSRLHSRLEAVESALVQLIAWRQHEILQAENIARELGASFTVMGVKHLRSAFELAVRSETSQSTYLSHRISEVRRMNKATSSLPKDLGKWGAVVDEVNDLHAEFARERQVLINPTAIDELRFAGSDEDKSRQPLLARRWLINESYDELLWAISDEDYEHTTLLSSELELPDSFASSVARSLASRIYFDVAFRDHVIVEHTPGLCVYRPFFQASDRHGPEGEEREPTGVDWSGGVRPEIVHWLRKATSGQTDRRRVAFVHTREEIRARIVWLRDTDADDFTDTMLNHLPDLLEAQGIAETDADSLCQDIQKALRPARAGSHLAQDPIRQTVQLPDAIRANTESLVGALEVAYLLAIYHAFTLLPRPPEDVAQKSGFDICIMLGHESATGERVLSDFNSIAYKLSKFFGGDLEKGVRSHEETQFWRLHDEEFTDLIKVNPIEFCCRRLRLPFEYLQQRSATPL